MPENTSNTEELGVNINYRKTVSDIKNSTRLKKKYIDENNNFLFILMAFAFLCLCARYFWKFSDDFLILHQKLFDSLPTLLIGVLFLILSVLCIIIPKYADNSPIRKYNKSPYKNELNMFKADKDGIISASKNYSIHIAWNEISVAIEHSDGFLIEWGQNGVFIPARFLSIQSSEKLRGMLSRYCGGRSMLIKNIKLSENEPRQESFEMIRFSGEPEYEFKGSSSFARFKKSTMFMMRRSMIRLLILCSPAILIGAALLILISDYLLTSLAIILVSLIVLEILFRIAVILKSKIGYAVNEKYNEMRISLYDNEAVFESEGIIKIIEYKNVSSIIEIGDDILIISSSSDIIRVPCPSNKKEISGYLNMKTML